MPMFEENLGSSFPSCARMTQGTAKKHTQTRSVVPYFIVLQLAPKSKRPQRFMWHVRLVGGGRRFDRIWSPNAENRKEPTAVMLPAPFPIPGGAGRDVVRSLPGEFMSAL